MMSEDEAKKKVCHKALSDPHTRFTRPSCLGTACMAWRRARRGSDRYFVTWGSRPEEEWSWNPTKVKDYQDAVVRVVKSEDFGYCGLAGKPEYDPR